MLQYETWQVSQTLPLPPGSTRHAFVSIAKDGFSAACVSWEMWSPWSSSGRLQGQPPPPLHQINEGMALQGAAPYRLTCNYSLQCVAVTFNYRWASDMCRPYQTSPQGHNCQRSSDSPCFMFSVPFNCTKHQPNYDPIPLLSPAALLIGF